MKNTLMLAALLAVVAMGAIGAMAADDEKPTYSIKDVMKQGHGGKTSLLKKVIAGEAGDDEKATLLAMYKDMAKQEAPVGDADSWTEKTEALVVATQDVIDGKEGAAKSLETASNCAACHGPHKPKKN